LASVLTRISDSDKKFKSRKERFDWKKCKIGKRYDGMLVTLFHYDDNWHVAAGTRTKLQVKASDRFSDATRMKQIDLKISVTCFGAFGGQ
jgi:hypothetical protein